MDVFLNLLTTNLKQGLLYGVLALGVYITYSILDFPDLSVDGTVPLGGCITVLLLFNGVNPWLALAASFVVGAAAGCVTGLLHVKLKIRPLLCGILVMTALLSVNLMLMKAGTGGMSVATFFRTDTVLNTVPASWIPQSVGGVGIRPLVVALVVALVGKVFLDWYFSTKSGMLLRATGNNPQYVTMLARDPGRMKILGLALGNGFAALAGSLIAQDKGSADLQYGTGMVVIGLASVIVGLSLLRRIRRMKDTTKVLIGSILYMACLSVADYIGLSDQLKLIMAVLFVVVLVVSDKLDRKGKSHARA